MTTQYFKEFSKSNGITSVDIIRQKLSNADFYSVQILQDDNEVVIDFDVDLKKAIKFFNLININ